MTIKYTDKLLEQLLLGSGVLSGVPIDHSGTIAVGNTAQQLMPANPKRKYLYIQNLSPEPLWIRYGATAEIGMSGSLPIDEDGGYYESPMWVATSSISIIGATLGQRFTALEGEGPTYANG